MASIVAGALQRVASSWRHSMADIDRQLAEGEIDLNLPMLDMTHLAIANVFYFATIAVLYWYMKGKPPMELKWFMRFYNVSCVILAAAVLVLYGQNIYLYGWMSFFGNNDYTLKTAKGRHIYYRVFWLYYIQKYWEFLDTFIFILRKSWRQVTVLHVYHHSSITLVTRTLMVYGQCGDTTMASVFNAIIHVLMYSHYLLATYKIQTWWKSYLTQMQLVQFMAIAVQVYLAWTAGPNASYPDWCKALLGVYMGSMLFLFTKFYLESYNSKAKAAEVAASAKVHDKADGTHGTNGTNNTSGTNGTSGKKHK